MIRLELFVSSLERSIAFYTGLFSFTVRRRDEDYVELTGDGATLSLVPRANHRDHAYFAPDLSTARLGVGVEMVIEVDDLGACFVRCQALGHQPLTEMTVQPWGTTDFRLGDPDGFYWRVTSRRVSLPPGDAIE